MPTPITVPFADEFIKHGVYLRNWTTRTVGTYRQGLTALDSVLHGAQPSTVTLQSFVIAMRERGLTPGGINMYARTINSYLSWLHAEGHISDRLRIKLLPNPPKPYRDVTRPCRRLRITAARVNPHALRHCFAVSYIRNGGDIYRLSRILGHASIATTQLYLRSMGLEHLQEGHAKYSPLGRFA